MLTKGIIEAIGNPELNNGVYTYTVRMPLFHGYGKDSSSCPTRNLPNKCVACQLPNEQTKYQVGDVVFVDLADLDPEWPVILGMLPRTSGDFKDDGNVGADQTTSGPEFTNVYAISTNKTANVELPYDIKIFTESTPDKWDATNKRYKRSYTNSDPPYDVKNYVEGSEIATLKFVRESIQQQFDRTNQRITSVVDTLSYVNVWVKSEDITIKHSVLDTTSETPPTEGWTKRLEDDYASKYVEKSNRTVLKHTYTFTYKSKDIWIEDNDWSRQVSSDTLNAWGIEWNESNLNIDDSFELYLIMMPVSIRAGGTGAQTAAGARSNLSVLGDIFITEDEFNSLTTYQRNTIYYIYDEDLR